MKNNSGPLKKFCGAAKTASFDASALPTGVYFYRLQSGKFVDVKKMLLTR